MAKSEEETDAFSRLYKKTEFDNLLLKLGGWSRFQQIQWVLLFLAAVPQAWYTYAPAFAAAKPKEDQIYCIGKPEIEGKSFCAAWQNKTCTDAGYRTPYNSIVTDVSVCFTSTWFWKIWVTKRNRRDGQPCFNMKMIKPRCRYVSRDFTPPFKLSRLSIWSRKKLLSFQFDNIPEGVCIFSPMFSYWNKLNCLNSFNCSVVSSQL